MDVKKQKGWKCSNTQFNTLSDLITTTCETICYINERNGGGKDWRHIGWFSKIKGMNMKKLPAANENYWQFLLLKI